MYPAEKSLWAKRLNSSCVQDGAGSESIIQFGAIHVGRLYYMMIYDVKFAIQPL